MNRILTDDTVGTVALGDRKVRRLGFGAMRISGARNAEGVRDRDEARRLVRAVYDRGVTFFDAANIYGYGQCEEILAEALHPYPPDLLIGTKAGFKPGKVAPGETSLPPLGRPEHIVEECEQSLRRLRMDSLELYIVHVPDPEVPYEETVGAFALLQEQGKVRHIGVSNVTVEQLAQAREICEVVCVQNAYGVGDRSSEDLLEECARSGIAFLPHSPIVLAGGPADQAVRAVCDRHGATPQQVAVAWLLRHSPLMLPIPGTSSVAHAHENVDAAWLELSEQDVAELDGAVG
ncbi:MAG: putative oxidoreductase [Frankiales bacterium]|nr:putative oxidoreductase [Frankiales bacterium]